MSNLIAHSFNNLLLSNKYKLLITFSYFSLVPSLTSFSFHNLTKYPFYFTLILPLISLSCYSIAQEMRGISAVH